MTIMASNTATLYVRCDLSNYDGNRNITITWDYIPAGATRLPYVIAWFERDQVVEEDGDCYGIANKKLSAIYQFAKALPLLFVPTTQLTKDDKKRKRLDNLYRIETRPL